MIEAIMLHETEIKLKKIIEYHGFSKETEVIVQQEFNRIVLCHHLWLKTEADKIRKDITYADRQ